MKEKGTRLKRITLVGVVVLLVVVTSIKYDLFYKSSVEKLNLTKEQKLEDFDQFYTIITTSFPNLEEVEKVYAFDFEERYDEYRKMIEKSEDDFVKENRSVYQLQYDLGYDKAFRDFITLNDSEGERVTVRLQKDQGDVIETDLYVSLEVEVAKGYIGHYLQQELESDSDTKSIRYHYSDGEDILYVQINDFQNKEGEQLEEKLSDAEYKI